MSQEIDKILDSIDPEVLEDYLQEKDAEDKGKKKKVGKMDWNEYRAAYLIRIKELNKTKGFDSNAYCGHCGQTVPNSDNIRGGETD